ncbi:MAG: hypothetical protein J2O39_10475 [Acidimicrobiales bacterium]|nr:hypothetical protein [Acidimicrobiales bacterium]MBO0894792.1 hypothetical protein [Acidimicrobiales bacterium]
MSQERFGSGANPEEPTAIERLDAATVGRVISLVERSSETEELVYREAEIDALWSLADVASWSGKAAAESAVVLLWEAHEAVGHDRPKEALDALKRLQAHLEKESVGKRV